MNDALMLDLRRFVEVRGVTFSEARGHGALSVVRGNISLSILVPRNASEWFIEVSDSSSGTRIEDWCEYAGHESTPPEELSANMRVDVLNFVRALLARPLRFGEGGRVLQWNAGEAWLQAVPLVGAV